MGLTTSPSGGGTTLTDSASLRTALSDENGTGVALFDGATSPTFVTPILGTPTSGNASNLTALNATQLTSGTVPLARLSGITTSQTTGIAATGANTDITSISTLTSFGTGSADTLWNSGGNFLTGAAEITSQGYSVFTTSAAAKARTIANRMMVLSYNSSFGATALGWGANAKIVWTNVTSTSSDQANYGSSGDAGIGRNAAGVVEVNNGTAISGTSNAGSIKALTFIPAGTATTCTGATIGTGSKSNAGFVTATTTGVSTIVITFPVTAPTGWSAMCSNITNAATLIQQTAKSTTTATLIGTTASGDVIQYIAMAY